ncbi:NAD(P)/FAD-dependent oxidoreductase [Nonomuraea sediminis]|uniref:NAD(P)/FAD-dependent oxidoreductase n=1 Tax=Nonomuraea sediminis TaxID=2835864 RepID=UPI001BDC981D|nr:NAD(P)/FAD-dependent oxidoreductase [Nonomuraea sediminis]
MYEAVVVGAGPAGLSAALTLGRARRRVLLVDGGPGRNARSDAVHNLLSRDGIAPAELRTEALGDLEEYPSVDVVTGLVTGAEIEQEGFRVFLGGGARLARRLLLATGVEDVLPGIPGLAERWGSGVLHCAYCHGWERTGLRLAVLDVDGWGVHQAVQLARFGKDVLLVGDPPGEQRVMLAGRGITVRRGPIERVEGLATLVFEGGDTVERDALFLHPPTRQRSDLAERLGCRFLEDGAVEVDDFGQTSVRGVFAAGDMARKPDMPFPGAQVVLAAAQGVTAAIVIDQELLYA